MRKERVGHFRLVDRQASSSDSFLPPQIWKVTCVAKLKSRRPAVLQEAVHYNPMDESVGESKSSNEVLLEVRDLGITYQSRDQVSVQALEGISFQIRPGESMAVVGESGSGKSTLALSILRILPLNASTVRGFIRFRGLDMLRAPERTLQRIRGARISMVFQQPGMALNPTMRVYQQVVDVIRAHRRWSRSRCVEEAMTILHSVFAGANTRLFHAYPHQLSGGERQRVSIAEALACHPELIIADEPTASLDTITQADILKIFHDLRGTSPVSLMMITHNLATLPGLADRVLVLRGGQAVEEGPLRDVFRHPRTAYTAELLRCVPAPCVQ